MTPHPDSQTHADSGPGVVELLRTLTDQGAHLAQQQVALVKAEVQESVNGLKIGVGAMLGAAVVGIAGLGVVLMGLAYLLATELDLWLATLIVGIATLVLAAILYAGAKKKMAATSLSTDRTRHTLQRAPGAATGNL